MISQHILHALLLTCFFGAHAGTTPSVLQMENAEILVAAIKRGDSNSVVADLCARSTDVNVMNSEGWYPLLIACKLWKQEIATMLLRHRADIKITDGIGRNALHLASHGFLGIELLGMLLERGINPRTTDHNGNTALHHACFLEQSPAKIQLLIEHDTRVNKDYPSLTTCRNHQGNSPLLLACSVKNGILHANSDVMILLISPETINEQNDLGETPLIALCKYGTRKRPWACTTGQPNDALDASTFNVLQLLLAAGADLKKTDASGRTALDYARPSIKAKLQRLLGIDEPSVPPEEDDDDAISIGRRAIASVYGSITGAASRLRTHFSVVPNYMPMGKTAFDRLSGKSKYE